LIEIILQNQCFKFCQTEPLPVTSIAHQTNLSTSRELHQACLRIPAACILTYDRSNGYHITGLAKVGTIDQRRIFQPIDAHVFSSHLIVGATLTRKRKWNCTDISTDTSSRRPDGCPDRLVVHPRKGIATLLAMNGISVNQLVKWHLC